MITESDASITSWHTCVLLQLDVLEDFFFGIHSYFQLTMLPFCFTSTTTITDGAVPIKILTEKKVVSGSLISRVKHLHFELQFLFDTLKDLTILPCGHTMHFACLKDMEQHHRVEVLDDVTDISCPVCSKSICDLSDVWKNLDLELSVERPSNMKKYVAGLGSTQGLVAAVVIGLDVHFVCGQLGPAAIAFLDQPFKCRPSPCEVVINVMWEGVHSAHGCLLLWWVPRDTVVSGQVLIKVQKRFLAICVEPTDNGNRENGRSEKGSSAGAEIRLKRVRLEVKRAETALGGNQATVSEDRNTRDGKKNGEPVVIYLREFLEHSGSFTGNKPLVKVYANHHSKDVNNCIPSLTIHSHRLFKVGITVVRDAGCSSLLGNTSLGQSTIRGVGNKGWCSTRAANIVFIHILERSSCYSSMLNKVFIKDTDKSQRIKELIHLAKVNFSEAMSSLERQEPKDVTGTKTQFQTSFTGLLLSVFADNKALELSGTEVGGELLIGNGHVEKFEGISEMEETKIAQPEADNEGEGNTESGELELNAEETKEHAETEDGLQESQSVVMDDVQDDKKTKNRSAECGTGVEVADVRDNDEKETQVGDVAVESIGPLMTMNRSVDDISSWK
ncbi:CHY-type/CTCHY-type/RING-type Zinc finger protein [Artemisia annua]|uniref:CHY-type/CTCHY-type/RING-type Zinc finger protein n=1 Tax=Artemisia annua TaxID=35608 RepID=A0A2U1NGQ0_ARTAN|nr:CHY-type/CTCHY-type/RING-type Zinc finger protein [Artemisia annua]